VVISQLEKPLAFYSRKLKPEQTRYTTTECELLSIVETLKEFHNILLGQRIVVYADHKNLTFKNFNTERVMRWRLILEEYGPELRYIKGESNCLAGNSCIESAPIMCRIGTCSTSNFLATDPMFQFTMFQVIVGCMLVG
jgi:RNase H-like domain found in reverse transcriptase